MSKVLRSRLCAAEKFREELLRRDNDTFLFAHADSTENADHGRAQYMYSPNHKKVFDPAHEAG
jgi:hypothetical protein